MYTGQSAFVCCSNCLFLCRHVCGDYLYFLCCLFWHKDLSVCMLFSLFVSRSVRLSVCYSFCLSTSQSITPPTYQSLTRWFQHVLHIYHPVYRCGNVCLSVCVCLSLSTSPLFLPPTNYSSGGSSSCCIYTSCERTCLSVCLSVSQSFHHSSYLSTTPVPGGSNPCCISTILCTAGRNVCVCLSVCVRLPVS